jgi:hypothetical protein
LDALFRKLQSQYFLLITCQIMKKYTMPDQSNISKICNDFQSFQSLTISGIFL